MKTYPNCQICQTNDIKAEARFDGKTVMGPWAYMCSTCFRMFGTGLGLGRGQRLVQQEQLDGTKRIVFMTR